MKLPKFKNHLLLILLLILHSSFFINKVSAQQKFTISGIIEDAKTGEKMLGANIFDKTNLLGTTTNVYGFYSITLPAGEIELAFSYVGYKQVVKKIVLNRDLKLDIRLNPNVELKTVEISAEKTQKIEERSDMSVMEVPIQTIKKMPAFLGEVDVIKSLQLLPGVQSGSEGSSGLYVRGGGPDQNLILLDGVPVYNASHLFGFFSVFNADALSNVKLIKGGYPARYGGRLSSVLDITMKEGNNKQFRGEGAIGLISSKLTLEGPIKNENTSFILSARRTYIDILAQPIILAASAANGSRATGGYFFQDFNGKINHKLNDTDRIYWSFYTGKDRFYFSERYKDNFAEDKFSGGLQWGNFTSALRWNRQITKKLFSNLTLTYSNYEFEVEAKEEYKTTIGGQTEEESYELRYFSGIRDWAGKVDFDYLPNPNHYIKFGASSIAHKFKPDAIQQKFDGGGTSLDTTITPSENINAQESYIYIEDDFKINNRLKVNGGLHFSHFNVKGTNYFSLQPRISARYLLDGNVALKASYATMQQCSNICICCPILA